ncbi:hypothetical protein [Selenomonas bovis]|nr:hypothetical protein [Selenomonas bovis]
MDRRFRRGFEASGVGRRAWEAFRASKRERVQARAADARASGLYEKRR